MKLNKDGKRSSSQYKVKVTAIKGETLECAHATSGFKTKAFFKKEMDIEVGQVVLLEYCCNKGTSGYIVVDDLTEILEVKVLDAQHIINDGTMYTSLILENPESGKRMHSLIPCSNKLFASTNVIITGDIVKLKVNNGDIFKVIT